MPSVDVTDARYDWARRPFAPRKRWFSRTVIQSISGSVLEVEVNGSRNENLLFLPIGKRVRGRVDWSRITGAPAVMEVAAWPKSIISGLFAAIPQTVRNCGNGTMGLRARRSPVSADVLGGPSYETDYARERYMMSVTLRQAPSTLNATCM